MLVERLLQRCVSELQSPDIRDIFALCEFTIHMLAGKWRVPRILIDDGFASLVVFVRRFLGPPIAQIAIRIELASLVIEAMRHLMSDDRTDRAVVYPVICVRV